MAEASTALQFFCGTYLRPRRVVISKSGLAVNPERAKAYYGIEPDIVFIRDSDGWTLGAPKRLAHVAYLIGQGQWRGFFWIADRIPRPISQFTGKAVP